MKNKFIEGICSHIATIWFVFVIILFSTIYYFVFGNIFQDIFNIVMVLGLLMIPLFIFKFPNKTTDKLRNNVFFNPSKYSITLTFFFLVLFNGTFIFIEFNTGELSNLAFSILHLGLALSILLYIIVYHNISIINQSREMQFYDIELKSFLDV